MSSSRTRAAALTGCLVAAALTLTACGSAASTSTASGSGTSVNWATETSAAAGGGMSALVAAAEKEGQLNAITLPSNWANYGVIMAAFTKKYGIKINDENPEGSSQDEITAITTREGQNRAPDVVDIGGAFATSGAAQGLFAPYKVATFSDIPAGQADPTGLYANDYGGDIAISCNAAKIKVCPTTFAQLLTGNYKGEVALNGDPTAANAAFSGVFAAALANGGSASNIAPGLAYFKKLKASGNFNSAQATQATVEDGETPITIDWDYLSAGYSTAFAAKGIKWEVNVPTDGVYGGYYNQAINKWAPHPAAARLWEEFLYSAEGQNDFLAGYASPVEFNAMKANGTLDSADAALLPTVTGTPVIPTQAQITAAKAVVAAGWTTAIQG